MLSRVADSIYWMARYVERAENLARLLLANQQLVLDAGSAVGDEAAFWQPVLMTTGDDKCYQELYPTAKGAWIAEFLSMREENPNSVANCIRSARENARVIRDQISDEAWQSINNLHLFILSEEARQMLEQDPTAFYEQVMRGSFLFQGIARTTMLRDEGWLFLQLGTYLERADKSSRLIDACSGIPLVMPPHPEANPLRWASLLHSCSAYHGFRELSNHLEPTRILEYLLLSASFPRSARFCVQEVDAALRALTPPPGLLRDAPDPVRAVGKLRADLEYARIEEILAADLHAYLDHFQRRLNEIGYAIFQNFVLYADLLPVQSATSHPPLGAWHPEAERAIQQQQQQQQ